MESIKTLSATFAIPKKQIKNSNLMVNHILGAQKSAWIRSYAEEVWAEAVAEQFPDIAVREPVEKDLPPGEISPEILKAQEDLQALESELLSLEQEGKALDATKEKHTENKALLRKMKKEKASFQDTLELEQVISDYDLAKAANAASKKRVKAALAAHKKSHGKEISKELGKVQRAQRKQYIAKKIELNEDQLLFHNCAVVVRVHNISDHDFDAPNFYPTVKPILDAATDTGIIWPDDNNNIISGGTLFLFGEKKSREDYIFEIEITSTWEWSE